VTDDLLDDAATERRRVLRLAPGEQAAKGAPLEAREPAGRETAEGAPGLRAGCHPRIVGARPVSPRGRRGARCCPAPAGERRVGVARRAAHIPTDYVAEPRAGAPSRSTQVETNEFAAAGDRPRPGWNWTVRDNQRSHITQPAASGMRGRWVGGQNSQRTS